MAQRKAHATLGTGLLTLALAGCGGLLGDEAEDEALFTVEGTLLGTESLDDARAKKLRAALYWEHWPEATLQCMMENPFHIAVGKCQRVSPRQAFERRAVDVKVNGRFPNTFSMPVHRLPEPGVLHGEEGSKLGVAYVLAYVDGNDNAKLDRVSLTATSSPDLVVGHQEGYDRGETEYHWIVYREGALHPLYEKLFGECPLPPQGYSLVTYRYRNDPSLPDGYQYFEGCFLTEHRVTLNVSIATDGRYKELACEQPSSILYSKLERATTAGPPPAGSTQKCRRDTIVYNRDETLVVNKHPQRFCSYANTEVYALKDYWDETWDDRATPPAWWPCKLPALP
ncbi:hypothetical protein [Myxococcus sp. AB036A]|uniref:hypothetical protein n=1 Tax=Myxococcus sp. AB036A TaxID=2562793 RepID=UPI0011470B83|nr:hypothetical protein [Myxococcus sp. AB036A]